MSRYANILPAFVVAVALLLGGTFSQSAVGSLDRSSQGPHHSFLGSIYPHFSSVGYHENTLIAAADEDSEELTDDKKDGKEDKDDKLKEQWESVQLG